jgi:hypothetical protein
MSEGKKISEEKLGGGLVADRASDQIVVLDIGGTLFKTHLRTLKRSKLLTHLFERLILQDSTSSSASLSEDSSSTKEPERPTETTFTIFLDLDPESFAIVLRSLRLNNQRYLNYFTRLKTIRVCAECNGVFTLFSSASSSFVCACGAVEHINDEYAILAHVFTHPLGAAVTHLLKYLLIE